MSSLESPCPGASESPNFATLGAAELAFHRANCPEMSDLPMFCCCRVCWACSWVVSPREIHTAAKHKSRCARNPNFATLGVAEGGRRGAQIPEKCRKQDSKKGQNCQISLRKTDPRAARGSHAQHGSLGEQRAECRGAIRLPPRVAGLFSCCAKRVHILPNFPLFSEFLNSSNWP